MEQIYLDLLLNQTPRELVLNLSPTTGSTTGYTHSEEFRKARSGINNPMYGREFSPVFIKQQIRDKTGSNNPQYGVIKSPETIAKLTKLVSVYTANTNAYLGTYSTVATAQEFPVAKDTLQRRLKDGKAHKGFLFKRINILDQHAS